jgi:hypothetical protein
MNPQLPRPASGSAWIVFRTLSQLWKGSRAQRRRWEHSCGTPSGNEQTEPRLDPTKSQVGSQPAFGPVKSDVRANFSSQYKNKKASNATLTCDVDPCTQVQDALAIAFH